MEEIDKLKRTLTAYKGHLTRATNEVDKLLKLPTQEPYDLEAKTNILKKQWARFDEAYSTLETSLLDIGDSEKEVEVIQGDYYLLLDSYEQQVAKLKLLETKNVAEQCTRDNAQPNTSTVMSKLPSIKLPVFGGELTEYEAFIDQFEAQIGKRHDLEPVTKLHYLKSQLTGRALDLIKGFTSTSENYSVALQTLRETYGDDDRIKHALFQRIVNIESPKHNKDSLESFRIAMVNLTLALKNKHEYSCCEWMIASLFQHKLPNTTIRQLYLKYEVNYFTLDQLSEGLRDLIQHMEVEKLQREVKPPVRETKENVGSFYTSGAVDRAKKAPNEVKCRFCSAQHTDSNCTKYSTGTERLQRLRDRGLCTRCMGSHPIYTCKVKLQLCRKCKKGNHHTTLCRTFDKSDTSHDKRSRTQSQETSPSNVSPSEENVGHVNVATGRAVGGSGGVALATAIAELKEEGRQYRDVRLFFDSGSQRTFITKNLVQQCGLKTKQRKSLTLTGFMSNPTTQEFDIVKPVIKMGNRLKRITAVVVEQLPKAIVITGVTEAVHYLTSRGIKLADPNIINDTIGPVDILVGADHYYDFVSTNSIICEGVRLLQSPSGYMITGNIPNNFNSAVSTTSSTSSEHVTPESVLVMRITDEVDPLLDLESQLELNPPVHKLWDLDVIGIDAKQPIPEEQLTYQEYLNSVKYEGGQYWVKLPWKINKPHLPNNYRIAMGQMYSLVRNLKKKNLIESYQKVLDEQLQLQFIEEVHNAQPTDLCHYLPHNGVQKDSITTPLRIVFNCSSRANTESPCLNDCLMTGPSLTKKLGDILLKLRIGQYAYTADISKAFLRIGLQEEDRDFTRFLWPSEPLKADSRVKTYRFKSVLFGATSSPFLLQATLDYHLRTSNSPMKATLADSFYVDNFQGSTTDEKYLISLYKEVNKELRLANMPLTRWSTNYPQLKDHITSDFPGYEVPRVTDVLGLQWDTTTDTLKLKSVNYPQTDALLTKRMLLSRTSKLFDPLGIFSPITIKSKILLQESWKLKVGWDDPLPPNYIEQWHSLENELQQLENYDFPRAVVNENENCSLHVFCDASSKAYGAVAYIVTRSKSEILTSKARVAPLKNRTIPQMELTALYIGTKLSKHIRETLSCLVIDHTYVWCDNEAVLQWVKNNNSKIPYVKNRVADIQEMQDNLSFMYVNTKSNPADLLSRGTTVKKLYNTSLWHHGPEWLNNNSVWPEQKVCVVSTLSNEVNVEGGDNKERIPMDITKFSSLGKLLRVTEYVFRFIRNIFIRRGLMSDLNTTTPMTFWIRQMQRKSFPAEFRILHALSKNHPNTVAEPSTKTLKDPNTVAEPSTKTLRQYKLINDLGLFVDNDMLIRCRGRIHNSALPYESKHPILLAKHHWLTRLVVRDAHHETLHGGVADTLITIRKSFWIPKARQMIKSCIRECTTCLRYDSRPINYPGPPPLPSERVNESKPFQVVGVDYTGSIILKNPNSNSEVEPTKVYICLFTCAATRAVHLELATDLSAQTFIRAFRRFVGRRSCPDLIISDNATNFKASERVLKGFFQSEEVQEFFQSRKCEWKFIPPGAPWQGGFYERMIGVVKRCLRKALHNRRVSVDELHTLLVEIEARINNRPLTYLQENIDEPEALTPNHLLFGSTIDVIPPFINKERIKDPDFLQTFQNIKLEDINKRFCSLNKILKHWNSIWRNDYLTSLREYYYGNKRTLPKRQLAVGDIVLIDCNAPRAIWPIGRVTEISPGADGSLRVVKVLSKGIVSTRTVDKLIPLEISDVHMGDDERKERHTPRTAALQARARWRMQNN